jgi:hypothetical protein
MDLPQLNKSNYGKIVVVCVAGTVSGGPEALHQLVDMANSIEQRVSAHVLCSAQRNT